MSSCLEYYRKMWEEHGIRCEKPDRILYKMAFHALLFRTPFTIVPDKRADILILEVSPDESPCPFRRYGLGNLHLSLVPVQGRVESIQFDNDVSVAAMAAGIFPLETDCLSVSLDKGRLHLEIFYQPIEQPRQAIASSARS